MYEKRSDPRDDHYNLSKQILSITQNTVGKIYRHTVLRARST